MTVSSSCFSNPADLPPVIGNRDAVQSVQCGYAPLLQLSG